MIFNYFRVVRMYRLKIGTCPSCPHYLKHYNKNKNKKIGVPSFVYCCTKVLKFRFYNMRFVSERILVAAKFDEEREIR